jgi:L-rhamnose mutarotase
MTGMSSRYCLTLDLKDDPALIAEYERHHRQVWPEVLQSLRDAGIERADLYRLGTRLVFVLDVSPAFSLGAKAAADAANPVVQRWEQLMWAYQQALPGSAPGEKWRIMTRIFHLEA